MKQNQTNRGIFLVLKWFSHLFFSFVYPNWHYNHFTCISPYLIPIHQTHYYHDYFACSQPLLYNSHIRFSAVNSARTYSTFPLVLTLFYCNCNYLYRT